mmetsp:Transcript_17491/g.49415  ORF Transcript_17491/g.49415 Transcript_17491/m.49415 type:complete len:158 (-) Transcript_17491:278-751(-)|eukprot:CAMPEP_0119568932 /NCGR_PEP_ID=MMETSP1352-20130426/40225_1 /TAXON_ID=265584 /ORGANISM="Stauroneis constricta, Strain CCMP1120" /LENGTH=157 /DNA_ID=CAMNT_0007618401 /DNA_START=230 /DNA_END=703 /DNA_ORIENTATION=-
MSATDSSSSASSDADFQLLDNNADSAIQFTDVEIREFRVRLGDNPNCSAGAPIALGDEVACYSRNLELYEHFRSGERRHGKKLILSVPKRAALLMKAGYTVDEIAQATMDVDVIKRQRRDSMSGSNNGWSKVKGMISSMKNVVISPSKPKEPTARSA